MILSFSGIDGSGKSTQIDLLIERLKKDGFRVKYLWARVGYTPGFNFLKSCVRKLRPSAIPTSGRSEARTKAFGSSKTRKIWITIALLDMIAFYAFYVRLLKLKYNFIICDRYVSDSLIDFRLNFPMENVEQWRLWKILLWLSPKPSNSFLFFIPVEESMRRSILKNEPFPDDREVLEQRLEIYTEISKQDQWKIIDGMKGKADIHQMVLDTIN